MKKLIIAIAVSAFTFIGTAVNAEARPYGGGGYNTPASTIYVSGYRHGRPVYTQKYFIGYDRCGTPRWGYRTVSVPSRGYGGSHGHNSCDTGYNQNSYNGYSQRGYSQRGYSNNSYGGSRSSGSRISFSFGR